MIFGNDNSSVRVYNNQDEARGKSLNIARVQTEIGPAFDGSADLPHRNRVPELQFAGIGFSFNESSNRNTATAQAREQAEAGG